MRRLYPILASISPKFRPRGITKRQRPSLHASQRAPISRFSLESSLLQRCSPLELHHQVSTIFQHADDLGIITVGFSALRLSPCTSRLPLPESPAERAPSQLRRRKGTPWSWPTTACLPIHSSLGILPPKEQASGYSPAKTGTLAVSRGKAGWCQLGSVSRARVNSRRIVHHLSRDNRSPEKVMRHTQHRSPRSEGLLYSRFGIPPRVHISPQDSLLTINAILAWDGRVKSDGNLTGDGVFGAFP